MAVPSLPGYLPGYPPQNAPMPLPPPTGYPPLPPQPPAISPASLLGARGSFRAALARRQGVDQVMSPLWIAFVLLSPVISALVVGFAVVLTIASPTSGVLIWVPALLIAVFAPAVVLFVFFYKLLERLAGHYVREAQLRRGLIDYLRARSASDGREAWVASELATLEAVNADALSRDREQPPLLALIGFVPIARWYLYYLITHATADHDQRWGAFAQQAASAFGKLGETVVVATWNPVPRRSFVVYLMLTVLTGGLFTLYWFYAFIKDGNDHFATHVRIEESLAAAVR